MLRKYRRLLIGLVLAILLSSVAFAQESFPNLETPSEIDPLSLNVFFMHRYYGSAIEDPLMSFLGTSEGANVHIGFETAIVAGLGVTFGYVYGEKEYSMEVSYRHTFPFVHTMVEIGGYFFRDAFTPVDDWTYTALFSLAAQTVPIFGIFSPSLAVHFDVRGAVFGLGSGLLATIPLPVGSLESLGLSVEFYPNLNLSLGAIDPGTQSVPAVEFGLKLTTYNHRFMIVFGNTNDFGSRKLMRGSPGDGWYIGWNIHRLMVIL